MPSSPALTIGILLGVQARRRGALARCALTFHPVHRARPAMAMLMQAVLYQIALMPFLWVSSPDSPP